MQPKKHPYNWKVQVGLVIVMIITGVLWESPAIYPLKILVVFFHELSHGLMAVMTGGQIERIHLNELQGGLCLTMGGNRFWTASAGYLGSLAWGGMILLIAMRTKIWRQAAIALGALLLIVGILYVRPFFGFGFLFVVLVGLLLAGIGWKLADFFSWLVLLIIGITSCMYAVYDIMSDIILRPSAMSDAWMLYRITGVHTLVWGILWMILALFVVGYFLMMASRIPDEDSRDADRGMSRIKRAGR